MRQSKVIITTMKNEAPYILEWVAHHLVLGFDHIVAFTNDCTDTTNKILIRLQELGHVTFQPNHRGHGGVHRTALRRARRMDIVKNADWLYVTDADEFLNIHVGDNSVDALIAASGGEKVDVIMIPWRIFSYNKRAILRDASITAQFTDAELTYEDGGAGRRFVKSLFRNKDVYRRIGLHNPHIRDEHVDQLNWALPGAVQTSTTPFGNHVSPPFGHDFAQINHYAVRSAQGYLLKKFRGRANHQSHVLDNGYWERWNRGGEVDTSIHRYEPKVSALIEEFRSDPILSRLHRRGFKWHKDTLDSLLEDPAYFDLYRKTSASEPTKYAARDRMIRPSILPPQPEPAPLLPVGTLWVEGPLSFVEQLCLKSFVAAGHPVHLYHYGRVDNAPEGVKLIDAREIHNPEEIIYNKQFNTPVVQADIFRLHMLQQTDCIWVDSDMLCMEPFVPKDGYLFGYFRGRELCNAVMRLPKDSPGLKAYLEYTRDEFPIHPSITGAEREALEASKAAGKHKHASEQAHSVYGPGVFTWFLEQSGEILHALPASVFYPVPFRHAGNISDINAGETRARYFKEDTVGVHLWGRRFRWWVAGRGVQRYSIADRQMRRLRIDPELAPIPTKRSPFPDRISFPADLPPQQTPTADIVTSVGVTTDKVAALGPFIRLAERVLSQLKTQNLYGIGKHPSDNAHRRIDKFPDEAGKVFALACEIQKYSATLGGLPDLNNPTNYSEKRLINSLFGLEQDEPVVAPESVPVNKTPAQFRVLVLDGHIAMIEHHSQKSVTRYDLNLKPIGTVAPTPKTVRPRSLAKVAKKAQELALGLDCIRFHIIAEGKNISVTDVTTNPEYFGDNALPDAIEKYLAQVWRGTGLFPNPAAAV